MHSIRNVSDAIPNSGMASESFIMPFPNSERHPKRLGWRSEIWNSKICLTDKAFWGTARAIWRSGGRAEKSRRLHHNCRARHVYHQHRALVAHYFVIYVNPYNGIGPQRHRALLHFAHRGVARFGQHLLVAAGAAPH